VFCKLGNMDRVIRILDQMCKEKQKPSPRMFTTIIYGFAKSGDMNRAMAVLEEMTSFGMKPNIKTHTTLIHGWALASYPDRALTCFEEMKQAGLEPDQAVYHCLMTSLLSRAVVAQNCVYTGILRISKEMSDLGFSVDLETAIHWSKSLRRLEAVPGQLTNAHCKVGNMERAEALVRELEEDGFEVPLDLYHTMMDGYTTARDVKFI